MSKDPDRTFTQDEVNQIVQDRLERDRRARVISEPRTYAPDSPHSFFADAIAAAMPGYTARTGEAVARLATHHREVAHEIDQRTSEGRWAELVIRERTRVPDAAEHRRRAEALLGEMRAGLVTGGGASAAATSSFSTFVSPYFLNAEWAMFRGIYRTFADQCHLLPLPPYGMEVYIPAWTSTDAAGQQTEGSAVTELDPVSGLQGNPVVTITGQITLSQQMRDRALSGGGAIDSILNRQLAQQLEEKVDVYALNQVITGGASVTGAGTWTPNTQGIAPLYTDIASGREQITDTAGVRLRPTHFFSTSDFYSYVTRQVDASTFHPWVEPQFAPGFPLANGADDGQNGGQDAPKWSRFTGTVLPGGVLWFTDDNIPASGANTQLIVSAPDLSVTLLEAPVPVLSIFPQTVANNLQVVLNVRKYVCAILRHSSGTATIVGNAYTTALK